MKKINLAIVLSILTFSAVSQASFMFYKSEVYVCSNFKTYDVVRHFVGGWGPTSWELTALCSRGTMTKEQYDGRSGVANAHEDIGQCVKEYSPELIACFDEFVSLNGSRGYGERPVIQGGKATGLIFEDNREHSTGSRYEKDELGHRHSNK